MLSPLLNHVGPRTILRIPLYILQYCPNIRQKIAQEQATFPEHCRRLYSGYEPTVRASLLTQLQWALDHPAYDFQSLLKGVKTTNEDILFYFAFLVPILEQAEPTESYRHERESKPADD